MIQDSIIDFATYQHFPLSTADKLLAHYDENLAGAINALQTVTSESLQKDFELREGGKLLFKAAKLVESIGSTINHWVHPIVGNLLLYMRLNDIAVPSIYGPSADEKGY